MATADLARTGTRACCSGGFAGWRFLAALVALVVALDGASKAAVVAWMPYGASWSVLDGFFNLVHVRNTGIAFSLFADSAPWFREVALPAFAFAAIAVILAMFRQLGAAAGRSRVALALILAGAAGNLFDRLRQGYVTDFLDFYVGSYHWPAFNVADAAITTGAALLLLDSFLGRRGQGGAEPA